MRHFSMMIYQMYFIMIWMVRYNLPVEVDLLDGNVFSRLTLCHLTSRCSPIQIVFLQLPWEGVLIPGGKGIKEMRARSVLVQLEECRACHRMYNLAPALLCSVFSPASMKKTLCFSPHYFVYMAIYIHIHTNPMHLGINIFTIASSLSLDFIHQFIKKYCLHS